MKRGREGKIVGEAAKCHFGASAALKEMKTMKGNWIMWNSLGNSKECK